MPATKTYSPAVIAEPRTVTGRSMPINQSTRDYFGVGDREELAYEELSSRQRRWS